MIERHIRFTVEPAHSEEFERFFTDRYLPAAAEFPGYVRTELVRAVDDPTHYEMTFRWEDGDAATGWRTSLAHEELQPDLRSISHIGEIRVYDVIV
jgi:heme-degrading monooxygenase HmoA